MSSGQAGSPNLPGKILATHDALAEVDHAFGGAIALAYYAEPRATVDIDEKSISVAHALRNSLVAQVPEPAKAAKAAKVDG